MSNLDPIKAHRFSHDFDVAQETVLAGVSPGRAASGATAWSKWIAFTSDLGIDPFLQTFNNKIPFLQIFAQRVHSGELAVRGNPLWARSAEDYIRHVAQTFLNLGANDPRLNSAYKIDFCLQRTLAAWKLTDPAPLRVKPIPISVIRRIATLATENTGDDTSRAAADMVIIAFFFLLWPGEYTDNETNPFRFTDTQLFISDMRLTLLTAPAEDLCQAQFASLTFTSQKNGVRGEVIGLACLGDPFLCPVKAIIRRVLYL